MTEIAKNYEATVDKFMGDAILIFFGDPNSEGVEQDANDPLWEDYVDRVHSRHQELTRSQVEATLISMRNKAIQSNLPLVAPSNEVTNLNFTSGETPKTHHDSMHSDPNEELSEEILFDDDDASIADTRALPSVRFQYNPSSLKPRFDFRLSSSSSEPVNEEIPIKDHDQINISVETDSTQ